MCRFPRRYVFYFVLSSANFNFCIYMCLYLTATCSTDVIGSRVLSSFLIMRFYRFFIRLIGSVLQCSQNIVFLNHRTIGSSKSVVIRLLVVIYLVPNLLILLLVLFNDRFMHVRHNISLLSRRAVNPLNRPKTGLFFVKR